MPFTHLIYPVLRLIDSTEFHNHLASLRCSLPGSSQRIIFSCSENGSRNSHTQILQKVLGKHEITREVYFGATKFGNTYTNFHNTSFPQSF